MAGDDDLALAGGRIVLDQSSIMPAICAEFLVLVNSVLYNSRLLQGEYAFELEH